MARVLVLKLEYAANLAYLHNQRGTYPFFLFKNMARISFEFDIVNVP